MKSNRNKKEYSRLIVTTVILLALVSGYVFLWLLLQSANSDVQDRRELLLFQTDTESSGRTVSDLLRRTETSRLQLDDHLLRRDNFVNVIEQIENIAKVSDVELSKKIQDRENEAIFQLEVKGSFDDIMYFLRLIETMPYRVEVRRSYTEQTRPSDEDSVAQWKGTIEVAIYGYNLNLN